MNKITKQFFHTCEWIEKFIIRLHIPNQRSTIDRWNTQVNLWIKTRGVPDTCDRIKAIRLHVTKYILGNVLREPAHPSIFINKAGIPTCVAYFKPIIDSGIWGQRFVLTLLRVSRILDFKKPIDLSSVTNPPKGKVTEELRYLIKAVMEMNQMSLPRPKWDKYHASSKSGPNTIATSGSVIDLAYIPESLKKDLEILGGKKLIENMDTLSNGICKTKWQDIFGLKDKSLIRKLSIVPDKEGKQRIIAIVDYWTQTALKPLHDRLFGLCKSLPQDMIQDQLSSLKKLPTTGPYHSIDLKNATDRIPVEIQEHILSILISKEYAEAWKRVMVDHEFYVPWENRCVKYATGQPMGAYSSWAMLNLFHHLFIQACALKIGKPFFKDYVVLGDDVVIACDTVAKEYFTQMETLGVEISFNKSYTSNRGYEFAKRVYLCGEEISGFPAESFNTIRTWFLIANELSSGLSRWSLDPISVDPDCLALFLSFLGLPHGYTVRIAKKIIMFWHLPKRGDNEEVRSMKAIKLFQRFTSTAMSCNQVSNHNLVNKITIEFLADIKARMLEQGLYKSQALFKAFQKKARLCLKAYKGGDAQSLLVALPPIGSVLSNHVDVQGKIDKLRSNAEITAEEIAFSQTDLIASDPSRLFTTRANELIIASNCYLLNKILRWQLRYEEISTIILSEDRTSEEDRSLMKEILSQRLLSPVMEGFPL